jgi:hypothetical protein
MTGAKYTIISAPAGWTRVLGVYDDEEGEAFVLARVPVALWAIPHDEDEGMLALAPGEALADARDLLDGDGTVVFISPDGVWTFGGDTWSGEPDFLAGVRRRAEHPAKLAKLKAAAAKAEAARSGLTAAVMECGR